MSPLARNGGGGPGRESLQHVVHSALLLLTDDDLQCDLSPVVGVLDLIKPYRVDAVTGEIDFKEEDPLPSL